VQSGFAEAVVHVGRLLGVMDGRGVEHRRAARPGVLHVEANALNQTASVHYDPSKTALADLERSMSGASMLVAVNAPFAEAGEGRVTSSS
jgi:hypothetical protein